MPLGHHRKPFSSKQKKEQLKAKRERKRNAVDDSSSNESAKDGQDVEAHPGSREAGKRVAKKAINSQPVTEKRGYDPNKFNLHFMRESAENLKRLKKEATKALKPLNDADLEVDVEDIYRPSSVLDMPVRPSWSFDMTKEQLDEQETRYFNSYLENIFEKYKENELSYFEMNLETWRQLWRVVEISDIILLIVDIRFPALHFSPKFYEYCTQTLHKDVILILNKIDLVPTSLVAAWKNYFESKYPSLSIILFSSSKQIKFRQKKSTKITPESTRQEELELKSMAAEIQTAKAHRQLYECVKNIVKSNVDLSTWSSMTQKLVDKFTSQPSEKADLQPDLNLTNEDTQQMDELFNSKVRREKFENGFVTIGCCGFPNVGKSSLLNSLNGRKVVSVSRTPGHTKHLQTIFLTKTVRLCDCPGLVFPSLVCKPLQVLAGIYPIAQLQEPYSAIRYLAERIPVMESLNIKHPTETSVTDEVPPEWSPLDICEAWALKRGYFTAKASRPDTFRAANELLRMALDGRLCLALRPRRYTIEYESTWRNHEDTRRLNEMIESVEKIAKENKRNLEDLEHSDDDDDDDEASDSNGGYYRDEESTDDKDRTETNEEDLGNKFNVLATDE